MQVKKAVITAAGRGARLYPMADTVQKATLPIIDIDGLQKSVIQIIAEEAIESGIEEVCIVCAPGDEKRYLNSFKTQHDYLLKSYGKELWAEKEAAIIDNLLNRLSFAVQEEPHGYGHAVLSAKEFVKKDPFLLLLGDYLYVSDGKLRCAKQLIELAEKENCSVSAVNPTIEHLIPNYGTLKCNPVQNGIGVYSIDKIIEKPSLSKAELMLQTPGLRAGYYLCFFGMHVFTSDIMEVLTNNYNSEVSSDNPLLLTPAQQELADKGKYLALEVKGRRYDTGKKYGLLKAQIALGLAGNEREKIMGDIIELLAESK